MSSAMFLELFLTIGDELHPHVGFLPSKLLFFTSLQQNEVRCELVLVDVLDELVPVCRVLWEQRRPLRRGLIKIEQNVGTFYQ